MLQLKQKQAEAIQAINDPNVDTLVLFGAVGTGKTDVAAHAVISICDTFPGTRWPVFRTNLSTAVETVIPSYLDMLDKMGFIKDEDYIYRQAPYFIEFPNKSTIRFREADPTKDRDGKKIKGINATGNHIDEADELQYDMFINATSRKGRRNENGQPSLSIITMNPNDGWAKTEFYDPWKKGTLPIGTVCIEFDINDSWQTARDIAKLKTNPEWWTQRYLYNNWDYSDESTSLFKSRHWAASLVQELDATQERSAGYDVASTGVDRAVRALTYGTTIADLTIVKDKHQTVELPDQADWLQKDAEESSYGLERTAIDAVGQGLGLVQDLRRAGFNVEEFMSGAAPDPDVRLDLSDNSSLTFNNLRSQMVYLYARGVETGVVKHFAGLPHLKQLQQEAMYHHFEVTDKVLKVESKEHIKKRLGQSPDLFDAVLMALYVALRPVQPFDYEEDDDEPDTITGDLLSETF